MRSWQSVALVVAFYFVSLAIGITPAAATTMTALDLPALTARAEAVVAGKVVDTQASWTPDHAAIYTDVTIRIDRALAGKLMPGQLVVVRREGGTVDGIGMKVYGAPSFRKDEDVVVFLERRGAARYVVGMAQGKLQLTTSTDGKRYLERDLSEVSFTAAGTARDRSLASLSTLDDLAVEIARIRALAKQPTP